MSGAQIYFVAKERERCSQFLAEVSLNKRDFCDHLAAEFGSYRSQTRISVVTGQAKRNNSYAADARVFGSQVGNRSPKNLTVVDVGTKHHLRMDINARLEKTFELRRNIGPLLIDSQQVGTYVQVSRMNRNVLRRESLLDNSSHLVFADRGECGVVTVKK